MNKIAVVLVVYNGERWLEQCLSSITSDPLADLFVWNNNSSDCSKKIIHGFPDIEFKFDSTENIGFGEANNRLVKKIIDLNKYDYCLLLNQDAYLLKESLSGFYSRLDSFNKYTVICPLHLSDDTNHIDDDLSRYLKNDQLDFIIDAFPKNLHNLNDIYPIRFTNAAAWFLKLADVERLGLFDPIFFYTAEDNDIVHRMEYHGFHMGVSPKISVIHDKFNRPGLKPSNTPKYHHSHFSDVFLRLKDIRYPYLKGFIAAILYIIVHLIKSLWGLQLWRFSYNLKLLYKVIFQQSKVLYHRKKSKELNGPFLNIND